MTYYVQVEPYRLTPASTLGRRVVIRDDTRTADVEPVAVPCVDYQAADLDAVARTVAALRGLCVQPWAGEVA